MSPEELELRGLIRLVPQPDGSYQAVESDPKRCAELRAIIAANERFWDARALQARVMEGRGDGI